MHQGYGFNESNISYQTFMSLKVKKNVYRGGKESKNNLSESLFMSVSKTRKSECFMHPFAVRMVSLLRYLNADNHFQIRFQIVNYSHASTCILFLF